MFWYLSIVRRPQTKKVGKDVVCSQSEDGDVMGFSQQHPLSLRLPVPNRWRAFRHPPQRPALFEAGISHVVQRLGQP